MPKRLHVIDGADQGQSFWLPDTGTVVIGNSRKHSDICLHDLYVGRVHCRLEVASDRVTVHAEDTPAGTLINGKRIREQDLLLGDVLRAGNSHLKYEIAEHTEPTTTVGEKRPETAARPTEHPGKVTALPLESLHELTGLTLGHFKIGELLGRGQYGVVFRAQDNKKNEAVALKVLAPSFPADDAEMQQFVRILKPVLPLRHPNVVSLLGAGKTGPYVWISQELVEGESVSAVLANLRGLRKIKWRRAWRVAVGMAQALEFLRSRHIVHGNITPQNIIVQSDGQPKLNDLVLAKALEGSKLQEACLPKKLLAEMPYLSPEHIDPNIAVDDLSDQFSLGEVVYALLTGHPPFEAESPPEILEAIRATAPTAPKQLQRAIPVELQAIVLKMLSKHPEDRYPSPAGFLTELGQITTEREEG